MKPSATTMAVMGLMFIAGCNHTSSVDIPRVSVSGIVTLDGKPVSAAAIVFHCHPLESDNKALTAFGFIENGHYKIDASLGPVPGTARVEFRPKPVEREKLEELVEQETKSNNRRSRELAIVEIPDQYGSGSKLTVEVINGENTCDFALQSRR